MNFFSSVLIIWANKFAYNSGFKYTIILTIIHFIFTFLGLEFFGHQRCCNKSILLNKIKSVIPISIAFCGFVVFNNLSLKYNTIGMYQLIKVMTTPTIVIIQYFVHRTYLPINQAIALIPVCLGVILATVNSLDVNFWGTIFGVSGVLVTSVYQIWVKTEQSRLDFSSEELLYYQAPLSAIILLMIIPFIEDLNDFFSGNWISVECIFWVFISSILAFIVNFSIFLVIGKSSPVSYNVLGHAKLIIILISGYTLFGDDDSCDVKCVFGICLAVSGIVTYTHFNLSYHQASCSSKTRSPLSPRVE